MRNGYFITILALLLGNGVAVAQTTMIPPPVAPVPPVPVFPPALTFEDTPPVIPPSAINARVAHRIWGDAEVLLWWTKNQSLSTPLVTTESTALVFDAAGNSIAGGIGVPGTNVLVGGSALSYGLRVGTRLTFGVWLDSDDTIGIEAKGLYLNQGTYYARFASQPNGAPLVGIPINNAFAAPYNTNPPVGGVFPAGENQVAESTPLSLLNQGFYAFAGANSVISHSSLWGAEANGVLNILRNDSYKIDLIGGFKYMSMDEDLTLTGVSSNLIPLSATNPTAGVAFLNNFYNGTVTAVDTWTTKNKFYGGQIGARGEAIWGRLALDVHGQVALGGNMQTMTINGNSTLQTTGGMYATTNTGGTLALQNNIGTYQRSVFSVLPEAGFKLNYFFTSRISGFIGYDFMYWTDVARVGDQITRTIDSRQVPTLPTYNSSVVNSLSPPTIQNSGFWAQGASIGIQFKF